MITMFILVVSIYCMMAIFVHVYYWLSQIKQQNEKHYVIQSDEDIDILEWYYRCFKRFSKTMGVSVFITVVGPPSSSTFIPMINRWERQDNLIRFVNAYEEVNREHIYINLNNKDDLKKLPF